MAIQLPNPGLGDGQTGDNEFVMWTKVKDNFSNTAHAASRLVGVVSGNVMEVGAFGLGYKDNAGYSGSSLIAQKYIDAGKDGSRQFIADTPVGFFKAIDVGEGFALGSTVYSSSDSAGCFIFAASSYSKTAPKYGYVDASKPIKPFNELSHTFYTTQNTNKEAGTGHLYTSSPVILLRDGAMEKLHEAQDMRCKLIKNGTGDYTITGTTGLRDDGDWTAVPPKDIHGNPRCMIEVTEPKKGVINIKTYKRKFDFELAAVVADLEQPFDIPEGASVRLHFNDLPQELINEPVE